jgi:dihydrodipicolinate synthase/N-acetylneuraminate lyase
LPIETVKSVVENVPSVVGWKMIYALDKPHFVIADYLRSLPRHVGILNTARNAVHDCLLRGLVDGGVQGVLNFLHEPQFAHRAAWAQGDMAEVKRIYTEQILPVNRSVYEDTSRLHIRYKLATWIRGRLPHPFMRPPMPLPRHEEAVALYEVMSKAGLASISRELIDETLVGK